MARVAFSYVGCKLNQAEVEALARAFAAAGYEVVSDPACADVHVVNTCTVTAEAARDSRRLARRGKGTVRTVLTGCHATLAADELARLPGVALVVSNRDKHRLPELVAAAVPYPAGEPPYPTPPPSGRVRALVKIQDGCAVGCSFCSVPRARGPGRSRPAPEIVAEVARRVAEGAQEVVLTGVLISSYWFEKMDLPGLVESLLEKVPVRRLRLSSLSPWRIGARELGMWRDPRLCRHAHLALQSGAAATLARMRRPYTPAQFADAVASLRAAVPEIAITSDVIVGFPGESEEEFAESLAFIASQGFSRVHAFPFSPRPGTSAAQLPGQLPMEVKRGRLARLTAVATASQRAFWAAQVGRVVEVLWERKRDGWWEGYTDTYVPVRAVCPTAAPNTWGWVEVQGLGEEGVWGRVVSRAGEAMGA